MSTRTKLKPLLPVIAIMLAVALLFSIPSANAAATCTAFLSAGQPVPTSVASGTVLCLHGGDYPHASLLDITSSGVTYQSAPGETARIVGVGITLDGSNVTLAGLTIDNGGTTGPSVPAVRLNGDHLILDHDIVTNGHYNGVEVRGQFEQVTNNLIDTFDGQTVDAECLGVFNTANHLLILGNRIFSCSGNGIEFYTPDNVEAINVVHDALVDHNSIWRGTLARSDTLIGIKDGVDITVTNNVLTGTQDYNWALGARGWVTNVLFANNTLLSNYTGVELGLFNNGGSPHHVRVINNVVDNTGALHGLNTESGGGFNLDLNGCFDCTATQNTFVGAANYAVFVDGALGWQGGQLANNLIVGGVTPHLWPGSPFSGVSLGPNGWWNMSSGFLAGAGDVSGSGRPFVSGTDYHLPTGSLATGLGAFPVPLGSVATATSTPVATATNIATRTATPPMVTATQTASPLPTATSPTSPTPGSTSTAPPNITPVATATVCVQIGTTLNGDFLLECTH